MRCIPKSRLEWLRLPLVAMCACVVASILGLIALDCVLDPEFIGIGPWMAGENELTISCLLASVLLIFYGLYLKRIHVKLGTLALVAGIGGFIFIFGYPYYI